MPLTSSAFAGRKITVIFAIFLFSAPLAGAGESELVKQAKKMLIAYPRDTQVMNKAAQILYKEGLHDEAVMVWRETLKIKPTMAEPHYFIGLAHFDRVQNDEAVTEFQKAIMLNPNYAEAHYQLGTTYHELKDMDGAIREYREATRINPYLLEVHDSLGRVLLDTGRTDEAIMAFRAEIRLQPNVAETYFNLGGALKDKQDYDDAIQALETFIRYLPARDSEEEIAQANQMIADIRKKKAAKAESEEETSSWPTLGGLSKR